MYTLFYMTYHLFLYEFIRLSTFLNIWHVWTVLKKYVYTFVDHLWDATVSWRKGGADNAAWLLAQPPFAPHGIYNEKGETRTRHACGLEFWRSFLWALFGGAWGYPATYCYGFVFRFTFLSHFFKQLVSGLFCTSSRRGTRRLMESRVHRLATHGQSWHLAGTRGER